MIQNRFNKPKPQPQKETSECKIKIKRNREGKIVGMERQGKCTREDMMAFSEKTGIELEEQ